MRIFLSYKKILFILQNPDHPVKNISIIHPIKDPLKTFCHLSKFVQWVYVFMVHLKSDIL